MSDEHEIEQRLEVIEQNLKDVNAAMQALLHARLRLDNPREISPTAASAWIAGELRNMAAQDGGAQDVTGYAMSSDPHDSVYWCYSRYVCPSVGCGSETGFWC